MGHCNIRLRSESMSKIIKVVLICGYVTVISQYIRWFLQSDVQEEILELNYMTKNPALRKLKRNMKKKASNQVSIHLEIPERLPTDFKYILKNTNAFAHKSTIARQGQEEFIRAKCKYINCYLTNDKRLLFDYQYYDAILFDVENNWDYFPPSRSPHQRYIFVASEPAQEHPICNKIYDNFYNLTWTYRLDSDIGWSFFTIHDKTGKSVGPRIDMKWENNMIATPKSVKKRLIFKNKVAAWFVSNCNSKSKRHVLYQHLELEFFKYNMSIDTFGACGTIDCRKERMEDCLNMIEEKYYFYLAFENALCEDYVSEKVLHGVLHYAVPIVYGGANYSRFLPPGSYINAHDESPERVAYLVHKAVKDKNVYEDYFRWHNHYTYKETVQIGDVCTLCEMMNKPLINKTVKNFRKWWYPDYTTFKADCKY